LRRFVRTVLALAVAASALIPAAANAQTTPCTFKLGFKLLRDQIPDTVGTCLVDEHWNLVNGDSLQETSRGLMVWRKIDNFTAFTDGYRTWVNGPFGVRQRLNTERFDWEPVAPPTPVAPVVPAPAVPAPAVPAPSAPPPVPTVPAPTPTPVPAALEQAPSIIGPGDGTHVGEGAKLEWDWYRGLKSNEEFMLVITQQGGRTFYLGKQDKFHFTTGTELPPGRVIRWKVYVRITNSENLVSQTSEERGIQRD
jgi:hypothetical protein